MERRGEKGSHPTSVARMFGRQRHAERGGHMNPEQQPGGNCNMAPLHPTEPYRVEAVVVPGQEGDPKKPPQ